jgi:hypothetical protein
MERAAGGAADAGPAWVGLMGRPEVWAAGVAVAVFLALYWMVRGAPMGQPARERGGPGAPPAGTRDRLVALAAGGLVLVFVGAFVAFRSIPWSLPAFAAGFGMMGWAHRRARPSRHESAICRRVVQFAETAMTGSLLAGVLAVANVAAFRYGDRPLDLTRERVHSLEPETLAQLRALERPLRLTGFYHGREPDSRGQVERVSQLLGLMESANPDRVSVELVDFQGDPARAQALRERVPAAELADGGVVVELGEGPAAERLVVRNGEMFGEGGATLAPDGTPQPVEFHGEYALSAALLRLAAGDRPKIGFTTGHGESPMESLDVRSRGAGLLRSRLADVGFEVVAIDPESEDVPKDLALVLVAGPTSPFSKPGAERLAAYLDGGGRGLFLLGGREPTGLEDLLRSFDLRLEDAVVIETSGAVGGPTSVVRVPVPGASAQPILRPLAGQVATAWAASPITILDAASNGGSAPNPKIAAAPLLRTAQGAWGETEPEATRIAFEPNKDLPGPLTVAAAASDAVRPGGPPDPERPRLVLFGSPDLVDNRLAMFVGFETDLEMVVNAANWLRGRLDLPEIAPRNRRIARLNPDPSVQVRLILLPTLMSVSILLGLGTAVYLARRS